MTRKKESNIVTSEEENAQIHQVLEQYHQIAGDLHNCADAEQAEAVLADIHSMSEATQVALLKALSREHDSDAADIVIAINELSPHKSIRKEARRSLIRLEEAKIYPRWKPPVTHTPAIQVPASYPPRFWKGYVTQAREEGEVQLILCWEQGFDYGEVRMMIFLIDFWSQGIKECIIENTNRRNVDAQLQQMRTQLPDIAIVDCTLAEGRRLLEEALSVNTWRGIATHKEFRRHRPTINQLVLDAAGAVDAGEDRGLSFINPNLEPDEVVTTFVSAWALGDYGLDYDLLSRESSIHDTLARDEWIEQRRAWANEAHPSRFELGFVREREPSKSALWLPSTFGARNMSSRREIEVGWSLELSETQLSGTLKEMPMGTTVYKETGRHWFWTSYSLVQEEGAWRIEQITDEGAGAQGLSIAELQRRIKEHDERINVILSATKDLSPVYNEIMQQQSPGTQDRQQLTEEIIWRVTQALHYDDALIVKLPLDRMIVGGAYSRSIGIGALERAAVYLERLARNFAEQRGAILRQLGITQESLAEYYQEQGMQKRSEHFYALAEASLQESLTLENSMAGHALLAQLLLRQGSNIDEAEAQLKQARELVTNRNEEAAIEYDFGNLAIQRNQLEVALRHYQRVAEIDANFEGIWFSIGFIQRHLQRFQDAKDSYERAIEIQPKDVRPYAELCAIYMNEHQLPKAREILEQGLLATPGNPQSAHLLALLSSVYLESGDLRRAQEVLEEAELINPQLEIVQHVREEMNRRKKK